MMGKGENEVALRKAMRWHFHEYLVRYGMAWSHANCQIGTLAREHL